MSRKSVVILWDTDRNGQRHGGLYIREGIEEALRNGHIGFLKVLDEWSEFSSALESNGSDLREALADTDVEIAFLLHASEQDAEIALAQIASSEASGPWRVLVGDRHGVVSILWYSGGEVPGYRIQLGPWVKEIRPWHVGTRDPSTLRRRICGVFARVLNVGESRFGVLQDATSLLSAIIHELHNRTAALRIDIDMLETDMSELLQNKQNAKPDRKNLDSYMAKVLSAAVGDKALPDGYLFAERSLGRMRVSLTKAVAAILLGQFTIDDIGLPSIVADYNDVCFGIDLAGREVAREDLVEGLWWKGEKDMAQWKVTAQKRIDQLNAYLDEIVKYAHADAKSEGRAKAVIRTLGDIKRWFDALDGYLRELRKKAAQA